jgi:hypothetical protein
MPWDPLNGARVGAVAGALVGAVLTALTALTGLASFWVIAGCGAVGGGIGYWSEKRKQRRPLD